jgi:hypothetical protein
MRFILGEFSTRTTGSAGTAPASQDFDANYGVPADVASLSPSKITGTANCSRRGQRRVNRSKELRCLSPLSSLSPLDIDGFEITYRTK